MVLPKPLLLVCLHVLYLRTSTYCNTARQAATYLRHQVLPAPRRLTLKRPHLTFSSGAELSHCEQRGKQSLFTNQLSSAPRQRGLRLSTTIFQMRFFRDASAPFLFGLFFLLNGWRGCHRVHVSDSYGDFQSSSCGHSYVVIPGNVILILTHKSSCQEPKQPQHYKKAVQSHSHTPNGIFRFIFCSLLYISSLKGQTGNSTLLHIHTT